MADCAEAHWPSVVAGRAEVGDETTIIVTSVVGKVTPVVATIGCEIGREVGLEIGHAILTISSIAGEATFVVAAGWHVI